MEENESEERDDVRNDNEKTQFITSKIFLQISISTSLFPCLASQVVNFFIFFWVGLGLNMKK